MQLIELADRKGTGFDRHRFVEALTSFRRFTPDDLRVYTDEHRRLGGIIDDWRRQIEQPMERYVDLNRDGPEL